MTKVITLLTTRIALKPQYFNDLLKQNKMLNDTYRLYPGFKSSYNYIKTEQLCRNENNIANLISTKVSNKSILNISHWYDHMYVKNWIDCPQKYYLEMDALNKIYTEYMEIFEQSKI